MDPADEATERSEAERTALIEARRGRGADVPY